MCEISQYHSYGLTSFDYSTSMLRSPSQSRQLWAMRYVLEAITVIMNVIGTGCVSAHVMRMEHGFLETCQQLTLSLHQILPLLWRWEGWKLTGATLAWLPVPDKHLTLCHIPVSDKH